MPQNSLDGYTEAKHKEYTRTLSSTHNLIKSSVSDAMVKMILVRYIVE